MKLRGWVFALVTFVVIGLAIALLAGRTETGAPNQTLQLRGMTYQTQVRNDKDELERGLSGTKSLPDGHAMLFVFPNDDKWAIWMKDMNYPIDIVWLDKDKKIVHLVKDAQPSSYPDTRFVPQTDSRYVIELPSGTIERTGITLGDKAGLPSGV